MGPTSRGSAAFCADDHDLDGAQLCAPVPHPVPGLMSEASWSRWSTFVHVVVTDPEALHVARREVDAEIDAVDLAASRFRPDSEISALSRSAGVPTPVSPLLADLIGAALDAAHRTGGAVDPT